MVMALFSRSDGSGTTWYVADYLSRISPTWKERLGTKTSLAWGEHVTGAKGSDGVVRAVQDTTGAIGETIAQDKELTKKLLHAAGVPVPIGRSVEDEADAWKAAHAELDALHDDLVMFPQTLVNVRVKDKAAAVNAPEVQAAVRAAEVRLNGRGRINLRPSGTENLVRVMVEGPDAAEIHEIAGEVAGLIR